MCNALCVPCGIVSSVTAFIVMSAHACSVERHSGIRCCVLLLMHRHIGPVEWCESQCLVRVSAWNPSVVSDHFQHMIPGWPMVSVPMVLSPHSSKDHRPACSWLP